MNLRGKSLFQTVWDAERMILIVSKYNLISNVSRKIRFISERNGIPHCVLVYPNKDMEIIDIRNNEYRERLYVLCK